ncbi:YdcF family protein [Pleomorphovibrio marinus]|uniref:YdcF family protein n=1 Tax=Pleomorphovibrio marinus TaxID=2164132 RepID=UPI001E5EAD9F|nr:YdcF family protein [Pleomorphovibrio marinus]
MPYTVCLLLLLAGIIWVKRDMGKRMLILGLALLFFFSNGAICNYVMNWYETPLVPIADLEYHEVGIVLTGVTNLNKVSGDRTFFDRGADRATHAVQLYKEGKLGKILITGGQGLTTVGDQREAVLLAEFMVMAGVDPGHLYIEDKARNTRENALFAKQTLEERGYDLSKKYLVITSAFHMKRALGCFEKVNMRVEGFPVDYYGSDGIWNLKGILQPSPTALALWHKLFKEWMGTLIYLVVGYI